MGRYSQLFSMEVRHSYFSNGRCHEIQFVPTPETARRMRNAGLLGKETVGGVRMFYDPDSLDSLRMHASDGQERLDLVFKAYAKDSVFMNYTDGAVHRDDALLYFDSSNAVSVEDGAMRLHTGDFPGDEDFQPLDFPGLRGVLTAKDQLARPIFVANVRITEEVANGLGEGSDEAAPRNYFVGFQGRQTIWKYFLVGEFAREGLFVADLDNGTEFEPGEIEVLADEKTAMTFKSKTQLRVRERSDYRFQLRERDSGSGKVLIRRLPVASAAQIGAEQTGDQSTLVSEMYINS